MVTLSGGRKALLRFSLSACFLALSSLLPLPPSPQVLDLLSEGHLQAEPPEDSAFPSCLPSHPSRASGPFGSFCGLGLLFLSTVVRKPLPQKVSAGGLVYRGTPQRAPGGSHTKPTDME